MACTNARPKFRAACDQCSSNKIKCGGEKPCCGRCIATGRLCHYSRSMRAGKPPRAKQALFRHNSSSDVTPRKNPTSTTGPARVPCQTNFWDSDPFEWPTFSCARSDEQLSKDGSKDSDMGNEVSLLDDATLGVMLQDPFLTLVDSELFAEMGGGSQTMEGTLSTDEISSRPVNDSNTSEIPLALPDTASADLERLVPVNAPGVSAEPKHDKCTQLATATLASLYDIPVAVEDYYAKSPSADEVLRVNSVAVQNLRTLMECSCSKDFHLPVLIAVVASKTISWFQATVAVPDPHTELPAKRFSKESVTDKPLTLGFYELDQKTCWTMKNQLVLTRLRELVDIITSYQTRFCCSTGNSPVAEGGRLYSVLSGFMRSRVQRTIQEIEARLD